MPLLNVFIPADFRVGKFRPIFGSWLDQLKFFPQLVKIAAFTRRDLASKEFLEILDDFVYILGSV